MSETIEMLLGAALVFGSYGAVCFLIDNWARIVDYFMENLK